MDGRSDVSIAEFDGALNVIFNLFSEEVSSGEVMLEVTDCFDLDL